MMQIFNLPHLSALTFLYVIIETIRGNLVISPLMPVVAIFVMARVPFVGCCMSICMHRYFAHSAFKTSRFFQFILAIVGCMAIQGGILWWASKHIRHHKHCDLPDDPHSPRNSGKMYAWLGWLYHETSHDWAYLPKRVLTPEVLVVNMMFPFVNMFVTMALIPYVGKEWALFLCWIPGIFGALATTRFNVDYHPPPEDPVDGVCYGINKKNGDKGIGPIRLEWVAENAPWLFEPLVGEAYHDDHHEYPMRAHRPGYDIPYELVLKPLARLGVIWDLQQPLPTDPHAKLSDKKYPVHDPDSKKES